MNPRQIMSRSTQLRETFQRDSFIARERNKQIKTQQNEQTLTDFSKSANDYIIGSSSVQQAQTKYNELLNNQVNTLAPEVRQRAIQNMQNSLNQLKSQNATLINNLNSQLRLAQKEAERYNDKWSRESSISKSASYRASEKAYEAQATEIRKLLTEAKNGGLYDTNAISKYLNDVFSQTRSALEKPLKQQAYSDYRQSISKPIPAKLTSANLDDIKIQVAQGVKVSDAELRNIGLTNEQIRETRAVQELEMKRRTSLIDPKTRPSEQKYANLNERDKQLIDDYEQIIALRDSLPTAREVTSTRTFATGLDFTKELSGANTTADVLRIINRAGKVTTTDLSSASYLKSLSNTQIRNALLGKDDTTANRLNKVLESASKVSVRGEKINDVMIQTLTRNIQSELNTRYTKLYTNIKKIAPEQVAKTTAGSLTGLSNLVLIARIKELQNMSEKKQKLTLETFNTYKSAIGDTLGIKKSFNDWNTKAEARLFLPYQRYLLDVALFMGKSLLKSVPSAIRTFQKIGELAVIAGGWGARSTRDIVLETIDATNQLLKRLPPEEQKAVFEKTKNNFKYIKSAKELLENPELMVIGGAIVVSQGAQSLRKSILKDPTDVAGEILSFFVVGGVFKLAGTALAKTGLLVKGIKPAEYIAKLRKIDPKLANVTDDILALGKKSRLLFKNVKINDFDYSFKKIIPNARIRSAIETTMRRTKAVVYGSNVEFEAKLEILKKFYKTKSKFEALQKYEKAVGNKKVFDALMNIPKDLDLVLVPSRTLTKFLNELRSKYRYIPELLQKYYKKTTGMSDLGLSAIRKQKDFVFSVLTKQQIDDLLYQTFKLQNSEIGAFKIYFLQELYKAKMPASVLRKFDVLDKLALKGTDFAVDVHKSTDVAFTKQILKVFNLKQPLPIELPVKKRFVGALLENLAKRQALQKAKTQAFNELADSYDKIFRKAGLKLNRKNLETKLPEFLEKIKVLEKGGFDFLQTQVKDKTNPRIVKSIKETLDAIDIIAPARVGTSKIVKFGELTNLDRIQNTNVLIRSLLSMNKKVSKIISEYDDPIKLFEAQRDVLLYYSKGSKALQRKILNFDIKGFKLKETLTTAEQNKLLDIIAKQTKELGKRYSDDALFKMVELEAKRFGLVKKNIPDAQTVKLIRDLQTSVERDMTFLKNFKTEKIGTTKTGIRYIMPTEQASRRTAGAVSTMFEGRRAKDIEKLIKNVEFFIDLKEKALKAQNINRFKLFSFKTKSEITKLKKLVAKLYTQQFREQKIFDTKGLSETFMNRLDKLESTTRKAKSAITPFKNIKSVKPRYAELERVRIENLRVKSLVSKLRKSTSISTTKALTASISAKLVSLSKSLSSSISKSKSIIPSLSVSKSLSKSASKSLSASLSASKSLSKSVSKSLSTSKSVSRSVSKSISKSVSKSASRSVSRSASRSVSISISVPPSVPPATPPPKFRLDVRNPAPRGYNYVYNVIVRVKNKPRIIRLRTTYNRAVKYIVTLVDNTTSRSFDLQLIGLTRTKDISDIKKMTMTKFRRRVKNSKALAFVEKSKYAIDTKGEKKGLKIGKLIKRRK